MPNASGGHEMFASEQSCLIAMYQDEGNLRRLIAFETAVTRTPTVWAITLREILSAMSSAILSRSSVMVTCIPQFVENRKSTICGLRKKENLSTTLTAQELGLPYSDIGARLELIRKGYSDLNQGAWAEKHNFNVTQYNNWEKGVRRIPVDAAERLCDRYGLTLDFIYRGRRDGLSSTALNVL